MRYEERPYPSRRQQPRQRRYESNGDGKDGANWIDFRRLREELSFQEVLESYGVELKIKSGRASGFCPLPGHRGQRRSPSFSVQLEKRIFQCFGCGARGNVLDFAILMAGLNPRDGSDVHKVAIELEEEFLGSGRSSERLPARKRNTFRRKSERAEESSRDGRDDQEDSRPAPRVDPGGSTLPVVVNAPLDFELKELDPEHPYLKERGFTDETIKHFGLGFCVRGAFKERVAIPLHDAAGQLIGYAGRITDELLIASQCPKYKFPGTRERQGQLIEFHKSLFLYNGWRLKAPVEELIVVEGFPSAWWLWQHGNHNVVAAMGSDCSTEQAALITKLVLPFGRVWVVPDGDDAGRRFARSVIEKLSGDRFVRSLRLCEGRQPTDLDSEDLCQLFVLGAEKSGTSDKPLVANVRTTSNAKPGNPMAAGR